MKKHLKLQILSLFGLSAACLTLGPTTLPTPSTVDISQERLFQHIEKLTDPTMEGRGIGSSGLGKAADYIAAQMKEAGLAPGGTDGTYFQPFDVIINPNTILPETQLTSVNGTTFIPQKDFYPYFLSPDGEATADVVFAGYGMQNDFKNLDVKEKFVIIFLGSESSSSVVMDPFDEIVQKYNTALFFGAKGVIFTSHPQAIEDNYKNIFTDNYITEITNKNRELAIYVNQKIVTNWLGVNQNKTSNLTSRKIEQTLHLVIKRKRNTTTLINVIGIWEPNNTTTSKDAILIGSHYDHLGIKDGKSYPGADDNASGVAAILEIARYIHYSKEKPSTRVIFSAFSGEEVSGYIKDKLYHSMLGSINFISINEYNINYMINLNMIGRLSKNKLYQLGTEKNHYLNYVQSKANKSIQLSIEPIEDKYITNGDVTMASDHDAFLINNIPSIQLFTGIHEDIHKSSDTIDKINIEGIYKISKLTVNLIYLLSQPAPSSEPTSTITAQLSR